MAAVNPRLAAGVGVLSVFLLLGGAPAASADPGDSRGGPDRGSSEGRDNATGGGWAKGEGAERASGGSGGGRDDVAKQDGGESPTVRIGSGRGETQELMPGGRTATSERSALSEPAISSGPAVPSGPAISSGPSFSPDPPNSRGRGGAPVSAFEPPRVTIGNGRSPGVQRGDPEPRWNPPAPAPGPAPAPAPPPPPPPPPPASLVDRISLPPVVPRHVRVAAAADWTDPLWAIAGLLLIPAAGAALGYRQARAAQAAERLGRP